MDVFINTLAVTTGGILGVALAAVAIFALLLLLVRARGILKALNLMVYRKLGLEERDRRIVDELRRLRREERQEVFDRFGVK